MVTSRVLSHAGQVFDGTCIPELCGLRDPAARVAQELAADLLVVEGDALDDLASLRKRLREIWQRGGLVVDHAGTQV